MLGGVGACTASTSGACAKQAIYARRWSAAEGANVALYGGEKMAPFPEEVDVFTAPHWRMKQLVGLYCDKVGKGLRGVVGAAATAAATHPRVSASAGGMEVLRLRTKGENPAVAHLGCCLVRVLLPLLAFLLLEMLILFSFNPGIKDLFSCWGNNWPKVSGFPLVVGVSQLQQLEDVNFSSLAR